MIFDVVLLIMRDADLYDDIAIFVKKHSGRLGVLVMRIGELLVGPDMASLPTTDERIVRQKKSSQHVPPPTDDERAQVKRELTENCKQTIFLLHILVTALGSSRCGVRITCQHGSGEWARVGLFSEHRSMRFLTCMIRFVRPGNPTISSL